MVEAVGRDRRDFVKLKALFYLSLMRRVEGESVFMSASQIAQGANACFLQLGIPHFCKIFSPAPVGKIKLT